MTRPAAHRAARRSPPASELGKLRSRLEIAEETLRALSEGKVDAIIRSGPAGDQVFTLKSADRAYRVMVETMSEGAITVGLDGVILYCNSRFAELVDAELEHVIGSQMRSFVAPGNVQKFDALMQQARNAFARDRIDLLRSDGKAIPAYLAMRSTGSETRQSIVVVATDLTQIVAAQEEVYQLNISLSEKLQASNAMQIELLRGKIERDQLARIVDGARVAIISKDLNGIIRSWNKSAEELYGYTADEVIGQNVEILFPPDRKAELTEALAKVRRGQEIDAYETERIDKSGKRHQVSLTHSPIMNESGVIAGVSTIAHDVTELRRAQIEALAAARYARSLIEASLDPLVTISPQGKISDVNKAAEDATGHPRTELIGTDFASYFTEPERARAAYEEAFKAGSVRDYPLALRHPSGAAMDVLYNANVYCDEKGEIAGVFAAARDVTGRKRADQLRDRALRAMRMLNVSNGIAIHATEELSLLQDTCRAIIEIGHYRLAWVGYAEHDEAKTVRPIVYAGPEGEDYVARANVTWSDQDERGRGPTGTAIRTGKPATARATLLDSNFAPWRKDAAAKGYRSSLAIPLKDGDAVYGALMVYSDEEDVFDAEETRLLAELAADMAYSTVALRTKAERDKNAQELQVHRAHLEELIATRTADLAATNAKLEGVNKELETFAYSVSHDLRSPLRAIDGFSKILIEDYGDKLDDEGRRVANIVREGAQKMGHLIDDILAFSRVGRLEMKQEPVDMDGLVRSVLKDLEPVTAERKLTVDVKPLPPAVGDVAMMQRVWQNLLDNAVKFTRTKDDARIEVGATTDGQAVTYYVKDNGVGFDMKYVEKLFGVFQRLVGPEEFPGTGIGLAIVKRIVDRHGGRVRAEGKPGEGASFYFTVKKPENADA